MAAARRTLPALRRWAADCKACDLWQCGTQTVFGEGPSQARLMLVGEQPGDREDLAGRPFVGPAGGELDRALEEVGIDRGEVYVTNAVKHFKWRARGRRRIHQKPNWTEMSACRPWLEAELRAIEPTVLVALGATAAQSLFGRDFRLMAGRGRPIETPLAPSALATIHPSSILRIQNDWEREAQRELLVDDLRLAAELLARAEDQPSKPATAPAIR